MNLIDIMLKTKDQRPPANEIEELLTAGIFEPVPDIGTAAQFVRAELARSYACGGCKFVCGKIVTSPALDWFISRNRFEEIDFMTAFLQAGIFDLEFSDKYLTAVPNNSDIFVSAIPPAEKTVTATDSYKQPQYTRTIYDFGWKIRSSFCLDGLIAGLMVSGGAYKSKAFQGSGKEAKEISVKLCHELFAERYEDIIVFTSSTPWSEWFCRIGWDITIVIIDKSKRLVWGIALTDTD